MHREVTISVGVGRGELSNVLETAEAGLTETTCVLKGSFPFLNFHMQWKLGAESLTVLCLGCFGLL